MKEFKQYITNCLVCPYFHINPPIVKEAYRCDLGAKEMPSLWEREYKTASDCPLPDVEKTKGTWIENDNGTWSCSVCHSWIPNEQHYYARFCLHCGARMLETKEE